MKPFSQAARAERVIADLREQVLYMVAGGNEPAAIVATPKTLSLLLPRWLDERHPSDNGEGSGWKVLGLPVYRSWDIAGPTVISKSMLGWLAGRPEGASTPYLF